MQFLKELESDRLISMSQALHLFSRVAQCRVQHRNFRDFLFTQKIKITNQQGRSFVRCGDITTVAEKWPKGKSL